MPVGASNERAAADSMRTIRSILAATGVPPDGIAVRGYHPPTQPLAPIRISYPKISSAGRPVWPVARRHRTELNRDYFENQPPWNQGCATQRNLAAMVDNPADLVQPRGETPPYEMQRTTVMENYRAGKPTATQVPNDAAKISDLGK